MLRYGAGRMKDLAGVRGRMDEGPLTGLVCWRMLNKEDHCGSELAPHSESLHTQMTRHGVLFFREGGRLCAYTPPSPNFTWTILVKTRSQGANKPT